MAPSLKGGTVSLPVSLLDAVSAAGILLLVVFTSGFFSPSVTPLCSCPAAARGTACLASPDPIGVSHDDVEWLKSQLRVNSLQDSPETEDAWHELRKGINPRTRQQQLEDLRKYKGISHYEDDAEANNRTALPCPGELLVEEHHNNYGEPWAGGRDVFEFLAASAKISPHAQVLEIGCGTLRVGLHFIYFLDPCSLPLP